MRFPFRKKLREASAILPMAVFIFLTLLDHSSAGEPSSSTIWAELMKRTPFPFRVQLPPPDPTPIDGTYVKYEPKETPPVPCRRCPDYAPEGGIWKLSFSKGVFRVFHAATGWKDLGTYLVSENQLILANDPVCHEIFGIYRWKREEGKLLLKEIDDPCAIGLRGMNLTKLPWLSCQPPGTDSVVAERWSKPPGCE